MEMKAIALDELKPGKKLNARKKGTSLDSLERSLTQNGLLVPLIVQQSMDVGYNVIAGNRRLACLHIINKKAGKIGGAPIDPVNCVVVEGNEAPGIAQLLEISRVENIEREPLHPVDEFEVFKEQVDHGASIDDICRRTGMKAGQVRQTLSLASMAQEIRDAWRLGDISAETAEAFTVTADHKAQTSAFNKVRKNATPWTVKQALSGSGASVTSMIKFIGREAYEAAGHHINETLFTGRDGEEVTASDIPALVAMCEAKLKLKCESLIKAGWGWAIIESDAPKDMAAWKRIYSADGISKESRGSMGCIVKLGWQGKADVQEGIVKPGDKVTLPKSAAEKKKSAAKRETAREESGGISNALAERLSLQLTEALRKSVTSIKGADAVALAAALLACDSTATRGLRLTSVSVVGVEREQNDLPTYFRALAKKPMPDLTRMLMFWIGQAIDLHGYSGRWLSSLLHPDKESSADVKFIASLVDEKTFTAEALKVFDLADYFASVSRPMIIEALVEMDKKTQTKDLVSSKKDELVKLAVAQAKKAKWLPIAMRLP